LVSSPNLSFLKLKIHFVNEKGVCPPKIRRGDKTHYLIFEANVIRHFVTKKQSTPKVETFYKPVPPLNNTPRK
jgi:hypothetical protein